MTKNETNALHFKNSVRVGKQKLNVETTFDKETGCAIAVISSGNEPVSQKETTFSDSKSPEEIEKNVKQFHHLILSDLEMLFFVTEKVQATEHPESIKRLGILFLEREFVDEAIEQLNRVLELNPSLENTHFHLGKAYLKKGDAKIACEHLKSAVDQTPTYPDIQFWYAKALWHAGELSDALKMFSSVFELKSDYHEAHYTLGLYLLQSCVDHPKHADLKPPLERLKDAEYHLHQAITLSEEHYDSDAMNAGFEKLEQKDVEDTGLEEFKDAYHYTRSSSQTAVADSEFYLKFMFAGLDKDNRTLDHYIKTIETSVNQYPEYADLHKSLGTAYLIKTWHFFIKAVEEYREAVRINPSFEKAVKHLKLLENDSRGFLILLKSVLK